MHHEGNKYSNLKEGMGREGRRAWKGKWKDEIDWSGDKRPPARGKVTDL